MSDKVTSSGVASRGGRRIEIPSMPFKLTTQERLRAALGLPAWVTRRKRLERTMERLRRELETAWVLSNPARWSEQAARWDLSAANREIESYNKYYPIERDLPMDPRFRDFVDGGAVWKPLEPLDAAWILREFPPDGAGTTTPRP